MRSFFLCTLNRLGRFFLGFLVSPIFLFGETLAKRTWEGKVEIEVVIGRWARDILSLAMEAIHCAGNAMAGLSVWINAERTLALKELSSRRMLEIW